jgi:putative oxidoreductase
MLNRVAGQVLRLFAGLTSADWTARLVVRLGVGLMFFGGALKKVANLDDFVAYFASLGIPLPGLQAPLVATIELLGGIALMVGLATRPAALTLAGTMVVALLTAAIPEHHISFGWQGLLDFLYLPEFLLLVLLVWLAMAGAGKASVDEVLRRRFQRAAPDEAKAR